LVSAPSGTAGTRLWRDPTPGSAAALDAYRSRLNVLLTRPRAHAEGSPRELRPKPLSFDPQAFQLWIAYHDAIERKMGPDGALAPIAGFAGKLPEHAARLAGVLRLVADPDARDIDGDTMAAAITLAQHYQSEALRLFEAGFTDPILILAEKVLAFIRERGGLVSPRCIYTHGPNAARDRATAVRIIRILEDHRWIKKVEGGAEIDSRRVRDVWKLRG
jgi:uncharacterized protein DUF3987